MYQSNNQHSCFDCFIYGNDLAKVRLLLPALLCIMVQTTLAVAKIWYLFDNAKYFSSHVRYNHKISCISEEIENVQKWTFSIAISLSPNSIIALKRLTLLAFRKSSNVILLLLLSYTMRCFLAIKCLLHTQNKPAKNVLHSLKSSMPWEFREYRPWFAHGEAATQKRELK